MCDPLSFATQADFSVKASEKEMLSWPDLFCLGTILLLQKEKEAKCLKMPSLGTEASEWLPVLLPWQALESSARSSPVVKNPQHCLQQGWTIQLLGWSRRLWENTNRRGTTREQPGLCESHEEIMNGLK